MSEFIKKKKNVSFPVSCSDILLVQSLWNSKGMNLFCSEKSDIRTKVWSHYSSICKCYWSGLLSAPVSDTFMKKKYHKKIKKKSVTKTHPTSTVSRELGPQICCTVRTYSFKDRLSTTASGLVRQCGAVLTGSVRGPHQKQTQVIRTALCSAGPPPPSFKHPQGPLRVWRTVTVPLQGGKADCGAPAT